MPPPLHRRRFFEDRYRRRSLTGSTLSNHLDQRFAHHGSPDLNSMADRSCGAWLNIARDRRVAFLPCLGQVVTWAKEPERFTLNPLHQMPGLNI